MSLGLLKVGSQRSSLTLSGKAARDVVGERGRHSVVLGACPLYEQTLQPRLQAATGSEVNELTMQKTALRTVDPKKVSDRAGVRCEIPIPVPGVGS